MDSASHENEERSGDRKLHRPVRVDIYLKTDSRIGGVVQCAVRGSTKVDEHAQSR